MKRQKTVERLFEHEVLADYYRWKLTLPKGSHRGIRYRGMFTRFGVRQAIKRLLHSRTNCKKVLSLDVLGAEYWVLKNPFHQLFTAGERAEARRRIAAAS
jgi:hypothetical protein